MNTVTDAGSLAESGSSLLRPGDLYAGDFEILDASPVGIGGQAEVFRARQVSVDRLVALKRMRSAGAVDAARAVERFHAEARLLARLQADGRLPYVPAVHRVGQDETGCAFVAMEWLGGETLRELLSRGPLPWRMVLRVGDQVAQVLEVAHAAGIVHGDLKPENLMLVDGEVRVLDWGVAAWRDEQGRLCGGGGGTLAYRPVGASVESAGEPAIDIHALGLTLREALNLRATPRGVRRLLDTMVSVRPKRRPVTASEVRRRLRANGNPWRRAALSPGLWGLVLASTVWCAVAPYWHPEPSVLRVPWPGGRLDSVENVALATSPGGLYLWVNGKFSSEARVFLGSMRPGEPDVQWRRAGLNADVHSLFVLPLDTGQRSIVGDADGLAAVAIQPAARNIVVWTAETDGRSFDAPRTRIDEATPELAAAKVALSPEWWAVGWLREPVPTTMRLTAGTRGGPLRDLASFDDLNSPPGAPICIVGDRLVVGGGVVSSGEGATNGARKRARIVAVKLTDGTVVTFDLPRMEAEHPEDPAGACAPDAYYLARQTSSHYEIQRWTQAGPTLLMSGALDVPGCIRGLAVGDGTLGVFLALVDPPGNCSGAATVAGQIIVRSLIAPEEAQTWHIDRIEPVQQHWKGFVYANGAYHVALTVASQRQLEIWSAPER